jgi:hypothetical protein
MSSKKPANDTKPTTVVVHKPDEWKGELKSIGGSKSDEWNNLLANQAVQALWLKNSDAATRDKQRSATIAALMGIALSCRAIRFATHVAQMQKNDILTTPDPSASAIDIRQQGRTIGNAATLPRWPVFG